MIINGIGKILEDFKKSKNWNNDKLAFELGLTRRTLHTLTANDEVIKTETLSNISKLLGIQFTMKGQEISQINNVENNHGTIQQIINNGLQMEVEFLRKRVDDLEKLLIEKDERIKLLTKK